MATSQQHGTATITFISLELYADGMMANFWLVCDADKGVPNMPFVAHDDRGNRYESWFAGLRGGAKPHNDPARWRIGLNFAPAIAPNARTDSFEMPELQLLVFESREYIARQRWVGPWIYMIALLTEREEVSH